MNKKLLICATIATSLFLTACVKKESPTEEQAEQQVEVTETEATSEPVAEFTPLEAIEESPVEPAVESTVVEVAPVIESAPTARPETAPAQDTATNYTAPVKTNNTTAQSEDDAVADAIAAAMPALEN